MLWNFHRGVERSQLLLVFKTRSPYTRRTEFSSSFSVWATFKEKDPAQLPSSWIQMLIPPISLLYLRMRHRCSLTPSSSAPYSTGRARSSWRWRNIACGGSGTAGLAAGGPAVCFNLETTLIKQLVPNSYMETTSRN